MKTIGAFEAKVHWSGLLDQVARLGQEIIITKRGKPVAKLSPCMSDDTDRKRRARKAAAMLKEARKKNTLGGISWKELRDAGRKW